MNPLFVALLCIMGQWVMLMLLIKIKMIRLGMSVSTSLQVHRLEYFAFIDAQKHGYWVVVEDNEKCRFLKSSIILFISLLSTLCQFGSQLHNRSFQHVYFVN